MSGVCIKERFSMRFLSSDIRLCEEFARRLSLAASQMKDGVPISRALAEAGISHSTFSTLVKGLRQCEPSFVSDQEIRELRPLAWEDDLAGDLFEEMVYIPGDFSEELSLVEREELSDQEREVIDLYYRNRQSTGEIADRLSIHPNTVRAIRERAIRKLRRRRDDLVLGYEYLKRLSDLKEQYRQYKRELLWISQARAFIADLERAGDRELDPDQMLPEEKAYFTRQGVRTLGDAMEADPSEIFYDLIEAAEGYGAELMARMDLEERDREAIGPDTPLSETGLSRRAVEALSAEGIHTVGEALSLSEKELIAVPGIGYAQIIRLYYEAIHGRERRSDSRDE